MAPRTSNPPFLNGVPEMLILRLLSQRAMHGYELIQALRLATAGALEFGEGCVYPILHRLESEKLLKASQMVVGARNRIVYQTTARGRARLADSIGAWQRVSDAVHQALQGGDRGLAALA
jgi:PadR family transcriptional regulator, regulatory protein PadR